MSGEYRLLDPTQKGLFRTTFLIAGLGSLFISTPFLDPINLPNLIAILVPVPWIVVFLYRLLQPKNNSRFFLQPWIRTIFLVSLCLLVVLFLFSEAPLERKLLGTWGRNNGLLTATVSLLVAWGAFEISRICRNRVVFATFTHWLLFPTALYGLIQVAGGDPIAWSSGGMKIFATFGNTNFASAAWALGGISALILFFSYGKTSAKTNQMRAIFGTSFALFFFLAYMTKSIQGVFAIGTFAVLCLIFRLSVSNQRILKILAFILVLFGMVVAQSLYFKGPLTSAISTAGSLGFRKIYWSIGLRMFSQYPIFGVGVDSFGDYYRTVRTSDMAKTTSIDLVVNNAHNTYIQVLATLGIVGFVAMVFPVFITFFLGLKFFIKQKTFSVDTALFSAFVTMWLVASFSIDNISIVLWNWLLLGLTLGIVFSKPNIEEDHKRKSKGPLKKTVALYDGSKILTNAVCVAILAAMWNASMADRALVAALSRPASFSQPESIDARLLKLGQISRMKILDPQHYSMVARSLVELQQVPQSVDVLTKAVAEFPRDFSLWDSLAYSLEKQGRYSEAISARKREVELDPQHARVWSYLAKDYVSNNDSVNAIVAARNARANFGVFAPSDQDSISNYLKALGL